ncbi:MAG: D-alanyl-D-alanine endopeptidase [Nitrosomonadales bacterium]|nr:D-alanyl-D-alanine endopeptidase [Nitrosomonadales bacterium]
MRKVILILSLLSHVVLAHAATEGNAAVPVRDDEFVTSILQKTSMPKLGSAFAVIYDEQGQRPLYTKNAETVVPIASITKLMTAMVILDANLPLDEPISIEAEDRDHLKGTRSRMSNGMMLTRGELLKLALMASENRAAAALARTYPGGTQVVLAMMNAKARELGMDSTRFFDPTGLHSENVSTAQDLVKMVMAAQSYDLIQQYSTSSSHIVNVDGRRTLRFVNTNPLVRNSSWDIGLSKTGYISEAGRCLVMQAKILQRPVIIVLLDSWGKRTRVGDAVRVKNWMENAAARSARTVRRY